MVENHIITKNILLVCFVAQFIMITWNLSFCYCIKMYYCFALLAINQSWLVGVLFAWSKLASENSWSTIKSTIFIEYSLFELLISYHTYFGICHLLFLYFKNINESAIKKILSHGFMCENVIEWLIRSMISTQSIDSSGYKNFQGIYKLCSNT